MSTLIIVHVEPDFKEAGCTEQFAYEIASYAKKFKNVINVTSSHVVGMGESYECLDGYHKEEWIWGYDAEHYKQDPTCTNIEGVDYIPTGGHDYSLIEDWMKKLPAKEKYVLVGGCRNECLRDVIDIFAHLKLKYKVNEEYVYGN